MSEVFISYARSAEREARKIAEALRGLGYAVWRDDELPAHRDYSEVIEERLRAAKAVLVVWSAEAVKSQWVRAEADVAREAGTLVQLKVDGATLPMPFNRIQCADLAGWTGDAEAPGWRKVLSSIADLAGESATNKLAPTLPVVLRSRVVQGLLRYDWDDVDKALAALGVPRAFPEANVPGGAMVLAGIGRLQDGLTQGFLERRSDPLTLGISWNLQFVLDSAGRFDEAEAEYERSRDLRGDQRGIDWRAVARMMALGDHERMKQRLIAAFGHDEPFNAHLPGLLKVVDEPAKALAVLRAAFDDPAHQASLLLSIVATFAAYYGDDALALAALKRAFVDLRGPLVEIWSPVFRRLRRDPRFKEIVRGVGLADHWRKTGRWGDFARPLGEDDFEML